MEFARVTELFHFYREARAFSDEWRENSLRPAEREAFLDRMHRHAMEAAAYNARHSALVREVLNPLLAHSDELSDAQWDVLYDLAYDMYMNDYDDPATLPLIAELLAGHYSHTGDADRLCFSLQIEGYGLMERSRMGDRAAGRKSAECFRRVIAMRGLLPQLTRSEGRCAVFVSYTNLIRIEHMLGNQSFARTYACWHDLLAFRSTQEAHVFDAELPRIPQLVEYADSDFRVYCAADYCQLYRRANQRGMKKGFDPALYRKLARIGRDYIAEAERNPDNIMHGAADVFSNRQLIAYYDGLLSANELCRRLRAYQDRCGVDTDAPGDCVDLLSRFANPINHIFTVLPQTSFSAEEKEQVSLKLAYEMITYARTHRSGAASVVINQTMASFCAEKNMFSTIRSGVEKEKLLLNMVISRQPITCVHSMIVSRAAVLLVSAAIDRAPELLTGMPRLKTVRDVRKSREQLIRFTEKAALFHDIGKNAMADLINTDERRLLDSEFDVIRMHPSIGALYLSQDRHFRRYRDVALGHHRFYDGSGGYPASFDNARSRIKPLIDLVTLCDCLDAATDQLGRNYQRAKTVAQVVQEFVEGAGTRYHPGFVRLLAGDLELQQTLAELVTHGREEVCYETYSNLFLTDTGEDEADDAP